jgi:chitodextrinase
VATVAGSATTFTDSGLSARTTYTYRVRAHNAAGDSLYSNTASARTRR